jgi:hypothetical protein
MPMRMRERVLNRGIPAPRATLLLQFSQKQKCRSMFFLRFGVRRHVALIAVEKTEIEWTRTIHTKHTARDNRSKNAAGYAALQVAAHTGRCGALPSRVASYYHRNAEARSWGNGRATWARRKPSSISMAIPARAAEPNGLSGDHTRSKDPHHPHHAYQWEPWDGKNPL